MERWLLRGNRNSATGLIADLNERVATPVMFGGGTLAVVLNAGALVVKNEDRDAMLAAMTVVAPGNALVILDASQSGAKAPVPKRLADAVAAAGGIVRQFQSPKGGGAGRLDRGRGARARADARARDRQAPRRADRRQRPGGRRGTPPPDPDRIDGARQARPLPRHGADRPDDVTALVAEAVPGSVWAFTDAVGERRVEQALDFLDRLLEATPEPVLLAVLHRRVRELIETGDRLAAGERLPAIGKAMGVNSEYRMGKLRDQAKTWTTAELIAALDGLVDLDAMVKGMPGEERADAQRRLAFSLWVIDHAGGRRRQTA